MPTHAELQKSHLPPLPQPTVRLNEQHKKWMHQQEGQTHSTWTPTNTILSAIMWSTSGNTAQLLHTVLNVYVAHGSASLLQANHPWTGRVRALKCQNEIQTY